MALYKFDYYYYVKNYKRQLNPVWHRMLYSCRPTDMATVGVNVTMSNVNNSRSERRMSCIRRTCHRNRRRSLIVNRPAVVWHLLVETTRRLNRHRWTSRTNACSWPKLSRVQLDRSRANTDRCPTHRNVLMVQTAADLLTELMAVLTSLQITWYTILSLCYR